MGKAANPAPGAGMSAGADIAAVMEPLDRMETLSRRLALHHRLIGDALDEASEVPAAANLDAVKDGLDIWVLQQEQLRELDKLVQDAHAALREDRRGARAAPPVRATVAVVAGIDAGSSAAMQSDIDRRKAEVEDLQDRLDKAEAALAKQVATDAKGVLAQVAAAMGHLVHDDAEAMAALAAGDFDALAACNLDWPEKLLAQALRGLDGMAGG